jgi:HAE1 family hydrophobic/amphiphilic exporter-1
MVVSALIVMGLNSCSKMHLELNPKVDLPNVFITTLYPGAGPEEVESQITKKIEDAVSSVNGIKTITSSSQEGQSAVSIEFNIGTSSDVAASDVREKISAIRNNLPTDSKEPVVQKFDVNSQPILYYGLVGNRPSRDIRDLADNTIKPLLSKVEGVASVNITGGDTREIQVQVLKDRLDAYGISIQQLVQLIQANNLNIPVGHEIEGNREYSIRVVGEFPDVSIIKDTRLHMPNGQMVRLGDIANIRDTVEERRDESFINGKDSVAIVIQKTSDGNTVDVARDVRKEVTEIQKQLPSDVKFVVNQDLSTNVQDSVNDVESSLFIGALLAVLVVFLFLHNIRGTAIVALAIPTSIFATFLPMFAFGFTLNTMTMLALSLAVGILVDDSIVVLENIYRHLSRGEEPVEAAFNGRSEIGLAAIAISMVDVVVYIPIAFMGGITGQFFKSFGITVASATLFSLFMSFTLTPMLASRWYRAGEAVEAEHGIFGAVNRFYKALDRLYRRALDWALRFRGVIVYTGFGLLFLVFVAVAASFTLSYQGIIPVAAAFVLIGLLMLWRYRFIGLLVTGLGVLGVILAYGIGVGAGHPLLLFRFAPDQDQGQVSILGEMPAGTSINKTLQVEKQIQDDLKQVPDVQNTFVEVGASTAGATGLASVGPQYLTFSIKLRDKMSIGQSLDPFTNKSKLRTRPDTVVADEIRQKIGQIPGANIKVSAVSGFGAGSAPLEVDILGSSTQEINTLGQQVLALFKEEPGVINADTTSRIGKPEQRIIIDRVKAASFGLTISSIADVLRTAIEGNNDVIYRENGNEYKIRVQYAQKYRENVNQIPNIVVGSVIGSDGSVMPVHLSDVATVFLTSGPTKIDRMDRQRKVGVTADVTPGYAPGNIQVDIDKKLANLKWGRNSYKWGGENKLQNDEGGYMFSALALSIVLVYMLMAALFDNLLYPLVIMLSLPQAMIGALLALMLTGYALTIVSMIGIIMLVGLVTKNAILLVDYTNTLRERGMTRMDAILEAGPTRLRPILMTTIAMIFGMLPTALGLGKGGEFRSPLAVAVIGGLILSTMLTLLVIPCVYTYFDDLTNVRLFRRKPKTDKP